MTKEQREKYEELSKKENEYKEFLEHADEGEVAMTSYTAIAVNRICHTVHDNEFKRRVMEVAKEMLAYVQHEIDLI